MFSLAIGSALMTDIKSGPHLGAVRSWMQWNCPQGEHVTWGSNDNLGRQITPRDLDEIAQIVDNASKKETREFLEHLQSDLEKLKGYIDNHNEGDNHMNAMLKTRFIMRRVKDFINPQY